MNNLAERVIKLQNEVVRQNVRLLAVKNILEEQAQALEHDNAAQFLDRTLFFAIGFLAALVASEIVVGWY